MISQAALDKLLSALDELRDDRERHLRRVEGYYDAKIAELERYIASFSENPPITDDQNDKVTTLVGTDNTKIRYSSVKEIQQAAYEVLDQRGEAMHRQELYDALYARGIRVGGEDTMRNFAAHLSHDRRRLRAVKEKKGYWTLRKWEAQRDDLTFPRLPLGEVA